MSHSDTYRDRILPWLIEESGLKLFQVENTVDLLREGATVPFIARYRKEQTGEMDEVAIRGVEERFGYFSELEDRKITVLKTIEEQGKLTAELAQRIQETRQKTELEDLYLPFKPKRRTKATIAKERGLEPLADLVAAQELIAVSLEDAALPFVDAGRDVPDAATALEGAGHIVAERIAENADLRAFVRRLTWEQGKISSRVALDKKETVTKFEMYYDYHELLKDVPSHRMLAMRRGEKEEVLFLSILAPVEEILAGLRERVITGTGICQQFLSSVVEDAYKRLLAPSIEVELRLESKQRADEAAIKVFADNLRNLLLAPPAGEKRVLGIDPGLRTGCKAAAVDATGRFVDHLTIYPHSGKGKAEAARQDLLKLITSHNFEMIAVGNGTAGRETEQFVREALAGVGLQLPVVLVSEAGASVYSASDIAREEFPDLDLTIRGAISIGRRLQDPLAELVKVDPKSIGVGQYQHDVSQAHLKKSLDAVVESCVNYVGVDLNTASWALLAYVSGLSSSLAKAIVRYRDEQGKFPCRKSLLQVPRFGAKAFEQSAGFLRICDGINPLDNTAVHPERYSLVGAMASDLGVALVDLVADPTLVSRIDLARYVTEFVGLPTLRDILDELKKPGRDPRREFQATVFRDEIREITDLKEDMVLQGVVTNVTAFGAFVDVGVHQDGLVHVSHLADRFIKNPNDAVSVGQVVKVKVLAVDLERKRISLSIREADGSGDQRTKREKNQKAEKIVPSGGVDLNGLEKAGFRVKKR
ncbi:MAG: RNA-binding transcriptional accessory protein [Geobacter sp.]|nr:MAG: RNA-binding transcriptional accessory protein [Geobacter sp.]